MGFDDRDPGVREGSSQNPSRRRLLQMGLGLVALTGSAGCNTLSPLTGREFEEYACDRIDDENTERYEPSEAELPFSFLKPDLMTRERVTNQGSVTLLNLEYTWRQGGGRGLEGANHTIRLQLSLARSDIETPSDFWERFAANPIGEIQYGGETNKLVSRDSSETKAHLVTLLPRETDGGPVYDKLDVVAEAILRGDPQLKERQQTDPDQTCGEALHNVALTTVESLEPL